MVVYQIRPGCRARRVLGAIRSHDPLDSYTDAGVKTLCPPALVADIERQAASLTDAAGEAVFFKRYKQRLAVTAEVIKAFQGGARP